MKKLSSFVLIGLAYAPIALAATGILGVIEKINIILGKIIPLIITLALIYFLWGVVQYIKAAGDPKSAEQGRNVMLGGVIALAVMLGVWGLVNIVADTFGVKIDGTSSVKTPSLPTSK